MSEVFPILNYVMVVRDPEKENTSPSGLFVVKKDDSDTPLRGVVYDVGLGAISRKNVRIEPEVEPGDIVLYPRTAVTEIRQESGEYDLVLVDDIYLVEDAGE